MKGNNMHKTMRARRYPAVLVVLFLAVCCWAIAPKEGAAAEPADSADRQERDPFSPSPRMGDALQPGSIRHRFRPAQGALLLPSLTLRGYVEVKGQPRVALLEVQGEGVFIVREGDTVSLQRGGNSTVLKIQKIGKASVMVEIGSLGTIMVVR